MTAPPRPRTKASLPEHLVTARAGVRAALDGVHGVVGIVESVHQRIAGRAPPVGEWPEVRTTGIAGLVYRGICGGASLVGAALDAALAGAQGPLPPPASHAVQSDAQEMTLSALNGIVGDHLARSGNPLAIAMQLRVHGEPPGAAPELGPHLLVAIHGLCMSTQQWTRDGHNHVQALASELDCTPVYVRYNSGLHVHDNGVQLSRALGELVANSPVPVQRIIILTHSMGGLVARAALHEALQRGEAWAALVRDVIFLGTPHHGAPLERAGRRLQAVLELSPYLAPFGKLAGVRSAGITDLGHGTVGGEHGPADRLRTEPAPEAPLPPHIRLYAVAGSIGGPLPGDGLVPVDSALGRHEHRPRHLRIPPSRRFIAKGVGHLDLLSSEMVYGRLRQWLAAPGARRALSTRAT